MLIKLDKCTEAEPLLVRVLAFKAKTTGEESKGTLLTAHHLGRVLKKQGNRKEALVQQQRDLQGLEKAKGLKHDGTQQAANAVHNTLMDLIDQGGTWQRSTVPNWTLEQLDAKHDL